MKAHKFLSILLLVFTLGGRCLHAQIAVQVDQRYSNGGLVTGSNIGHWEVNYFAPYPLIDQPIVFNFANGSSETMQADQSVHNFEKYWVWYQNGAMANTVVNHLTFGINGNTTSLRSQFLPTNTGVSIRASLLAAPSVGGAKISFMDPWLIDYPDPAHGNAMQNRGMNAPYKEQTSPFVPNGAYGTDSYQGVFLNQGGDNLNSPVPPYYSLQVSCVQNAFLSQTGMTHKLYLNSWSASGANLQKYYGYDAQFNIPGPSMTNNVVFTSGNAAVSANYNATQISSQSDAYSNNSQRKVATDQRGDLFRTYESTGSVWMEMSTNNGQSWDFANYAKPVNARPARSSSLACSNGMSVVLTYQQQSAQTGYSEIKVVNVRTTTYNGVVQFFLTDLATFQVNNPTDVDLNPVSSLNYDIVVGEGAENASSSEIQHYHNRLCTAWEESGNLIVRYANASSLGSSPVVIYSPTPYIINNAKHAAAASYYNDYLAWEHVNSSTSSDIYYMKYNLALGNNSTPVIDVITAPVNISSGSGYDKNYNPSIIDGGPDARVSWIGYRAGAVGQDDKMSKLGKISRDEEEEYRVIFRDPGYNHFWNFGTATQSPTIAMNNDRTMYFLMWSENDGQYNKYVTSYYLSTLGTTNTTGKDVQLMPEQGSGNAMYCDAFQSSGTPYFMKCSSQLPTLTKTQSDPVATGREGVVGKAGGLTFFAFGDISIDGNKVGFTRLPDTLDISSLPVLNSSLITESFHVTPTSQFLYSVSYGVRDTTKLKAAMQPGDYIKYRIEVIDDQTNECIGDFDEVEYSRDNIESHSNIAWEVATANFLCERVVRLRLAVESNIIPAVSLAEKYADVSTIGTSLAKRERRTIELKHSAIAGSFALNQNYPNPFNPATQIAYQLKNPGMVRLAIYDMLGREIAVLVNERQESGFYSATWHAGGLSSGTYIYRISVKDENGKSRFSETKRMMLVK